LKFHAEDEAVTAPGKFTWNRLLTVVDLVAQCSAAKGVFREMEARVFMGDEWIGYVEIVSI